MRRRYFTLDVFTTQRFAGNPLAVVLDSSGLDGAAMQSIAREFNLPETVFVLPASDPKHRARVRIFTPARELPFAGHPTVGTAVLLAHLDGETGSREIVLAEEVGPVACEVQPGGAGGRATFAIPKIPERLGGLSVVMPESSPPRSGSRPPTSAAATSLRRTGTPETPSPSCRCGTAKRSAARGRTWRDGTKPSAKAIRPAPFCSAGRSSILRIPITRACLPRRWASSKTRRPARRWRPLPACLPPPASGTAGTTSSSSRATRWGGRACCTFRSRFAGRARERDRRRRRGPSSAKA